MWGFLKGHRAFWRPPESVRDGSRGPWARSRGFPGSLGRSWGLLGASWVGSGASWKLPEGSGRAPGDPPGTLRGLPRGPWGRLGRPGGRPTPAVLTSLRCWGPLGGSGGVLDWSGGTGGGWCSGGDLGRLWAVLKACRKKRPTPKSKTMVFFA